jgi:hypothetical protein
MNMKESEERSLKNLLIVCLLSFSVLGFSSDVDEKITKVLNASAVERKVLLGELKDDVSNIKYNNTESNKTANSAKSIDEKIKNRKSKFIPRSKCGMGKCGTSSARCGGGKSHGSKANTCD